MQDRVAWHQFEDRYREMLLRFCRKRGLQHADADDVVQTVFVNLARALPGFIYDSQRGRFRDYLFQRVRGAIAAWARRTNGRPRALDIHNDTALASGDAASEDESAAWQDEWVAHHYRLALEAVRGMFDPRSVELFGRNLTGESVSALAVAYGMTDHAVYACRRRIRARMQELIARQVAEEDQVDVAPESAGESS